MPAGRANTQGPAPHSDPFPSLPTPVVSSALPAWRIAHSKVHALGGGGWAGATGTKGRAAAAEHYTAVPRTDKDKEVGRADCRLRCPASARLPRGARVSLSSRVPYRRDGTHTLASPTPPSQVNRSLHFWSPPPRTCRSRRRRRHVLYVTRARLTRLISDRHARRWSDTSSRREEGGEAADETDRTHIEVRVFLLYYCTRLFRFYRSIKKRVVRLVCFGFTLRPRTKW